MEPVNRVPSWPGTSKPGTSKRVTSKRVAVKRVTIKLGVSPCEFGITDIKHTLYSRFLHCPAFK